MLTPENLILAALLACLVGAVVTLFVAHRRELAGQVALGVTILAAALVFSAVAQVLSHGPSAGSALYFTLPRFGFGLRLYVDGLTCVFLLLTALISVPAALYSTLYMHHYPQYSVGRYYPHFLVFLSAMYGLVSTTDMMWFFFTFWQLMTFTGFALIRFDRDNPKFVRAANKYLIMMEIACAATMVGAELLALGGGTNRYDFDTVSQNLPLLLSTKPMATTMAFGLFLIGFGIKMGMWPFGQIWLPDAHPAAPSPISAMLSGVMIKTGVYGLLRYFLWLVPPAGWAHYPLANWGALVAVLGTITLFTGTVQGLQQDQSKRLLAFSSIGQIGYIILGAGACMALLPTSPTLATFALFGTLFHVLNHGVFKALLFLNAGSVVYATGTQDMNKLGGLVKFMPLTAITALIASFSISGVPLSSGFASKWAIYVALLQNSEARYLPLCAIIAILTSALTLALMIKFFGTIFLSRSSELVTEQAAKKPLEVSRVMQAPQLFLAGLCVLVGLFPIIGFRIVQVALQNSNQGYGALLKTGSETIEMGAWGGISDARSAALLVPLVMLVLLAALLLATWALARIGGAKRRAAEPWLCGYARQAPCNRYVARNFYGEIKRYCRWFGHAPPAASKDTST